jgi:signal recognition particle subunit SRP19
MARKKTNDMVLWPEYFDLNLTRNQGRRVNKEDAIPSPDAETIFQACRKLGLYPEIKKDKAFPSRWFDPKGMVVVQRKYTKPETILKIAKKLK